MFNLCHLFLAAPRYVYDQSEQHGNEDGLQDKLLYVDLATGHEKRSVCIALNPEKLAPCAVQLSANSRTVISMAKSIRFIRPRRHSITLAGSLIQAKRRAI